MEKPLFIDLLCAILAIMLLWAAIVDIRTRRIANRLNLAIALMAPLFWWATGTELWPDAAIRVGVAMSGFPDGHDGRR
jgi:prepilin peptidase CpaA